MQKLCNNFKHKINHCFVNDKYIGCTKCDKLIDIINLFVQNNNGILLNWDNNKSRSKLFIHCNLCSNQFNRTWKNIRNGSWCSCQHKHTRVIKWTLDLFIKEANKIHKNKFSYIYITNDNIQGCKSRLRIICNICKYDWMQTLDCHIQGYGCPNCAKQAPYTLSSFLIRAHEIHGNKFNYTQITENHIKGKNSHLPVICNECEYYWEPSIVSHINHESGCPSCYGNAPWTLERFLKIAKKIHGEKYDYSKITSIHIQTAHSKVPIKCSICDYEWETTIDVHKKGHGCPGCANQIPWTLERFLKRVDKIHGIKYDYSKITINDFNGRKSKIIITCRLCTHTWNPTIDSHCNGRGCPKCKLSHGESAISVFLDKYNIKYEIEYKIDSCINLNTSILNKYNISNNLKKYRYDFYLPEHNCFIEYDGIQHFEYNEFFYKNISRFKHRRLIDYVKTHFLPNNIRLIRIDYTNINNINEILINALNSLMQTSHKLFCTSSELYSWLYNNIDILFDN